MLDIPEQGDFTYQDFYGQIYHNQWRWAYGGTVLDMTTIVQQPYVWGQQAAGEFRGRNLYRKGVVTVHRTVVRPFDGGYELLADGVSQYVDFIRVSYHCYPLPTDPFLHHLDQGVSDQIEHVILQGPRLATPQESGQEAAWGAVADDGSVAAGSMEFVDVWS